MNFNSGRNDNEIHTMENIQLVMVEESLPEGKMFQNCFKVYPHCFIFILMCVKWREVPACGTILVRPYVVS